MLRRWDRKVTWGTTIKHLKKWPASLKPGYQSWSCVQFKFSAKHHTSAETPPALASPLSSGSLSRLGQCLDRSWQHKKLMAPGCEPASVRVLMNALRPLVLGQSLAGAGGGGFLYLLTKEPRQQEVVLQVLRNTTVRTSRALQQFERLS